MEKRKKDRVMLQWRLRVLMAEKRISNKELAELSGMHPTTISKLKSLDEVDRISSKTINALCDGLNKAYHARGDLKLITPNDLFNYTFEDDGNDPPAVSLQIPTNKESNRDSSLAKRSQRRKPSDSKIVQFLSWRAG